MIIIIMNMIYIINIFKNDESFTCINVHIYN